MGAIKQFRDERERRIAELKENKEFDETSLNWTKDAFDVQYQYNFDWLGRPIIQIPTDIVAIQELIWSVRPDLIIEAGIAHGGSLILSASMLALLDIKDGQYEPKNRKVLGLDIDIRSHNREAIESHPLSYLIQMIEGSSIQEDTINEVHEVASAYNKILVLLDSMHTRDHVLSELDAYAPLVSKGSYCVVYDTIIENLPKGYWPDRPWDVGNSPKNAIDSWIQGRDDFVIDANVTQKLKISSNPGGFLKRVN